MNKVINGSGNTFSLIHRKRVGMGVPTILVLLGYAERLKDGPEPQPYLFSMNMTLFMQSDSLALPKTSLL